MAQNHKKITMTITYTPGQGVSVSGPLRDNILALGMLSEAERQVRMLLSGQVQPNQKQSDIVIPDLHMKM